MSRARSPLDLQVEDTTGYSAYVREGIVSQVKVPLVMKFNSYRRCLVQPKSEGGDELPLPDLAKFGRSEQLHIAVQASTRGQNQPNTAETRNRNDCPSVPLGERGKAAILFPEHAHKESQLLRLADRKFDHRWLMKTRGYS